jgi:hypothetical protein
MSGMSFFYLAFSSSANFLLQERLSPLLDRMTAHSPTGWGIPITESMAGWAEELSSIQSSTVARLGKTLVHCDARLRTLVEPTPEQSIKVSPTRKSSRPHVKPTTGAAGASGSSAAKSKSGDIYINATKVSVIFLISSLADFVVV